SGCCRRRLGCIAKYTGNQLFCSLARRCIMAREVLRLSEQERALLGQHYGFYRALATGSRKATTEAQHHFVAAARGQAEPTTDHEKAWCNFRKLMALTTMREQAVADEGFRLEVVIHAE